MATITALCAMAFAGCNDKVSDEVQKEQGNTEQAESQQALYRSVTAEEYSNSDPDMRRLIDMLDGATNALLAMRQNGAIRPCEATVSYTTETGSEFTDGIIFINLLGTPDSETDKEGGDAPKKESCMGCSPREQYKCYKKIRSKMKREHLKEIDVKLVVVNKDCIELTY